MLPKWSSSKLLPRFRFISYPLMFPKWNQFIWKSPLSHFCCSFYLIICVSVSVFFISWFSYGYVPIVVLDCGSSPTNVQMGMYAQNTQKNSLQHIKSDQDLGFVCFFAVFNQCTHNTCLWHRGEKRETKKEWRTETNCACFYSGINFKNCSS